MVFQMKRKGHMSQNAQNEGKDSETHGAREDSGEKGEPRM
jgi:hypothetical protein